MDDVGTHFPRRSRPSQAFLVTVASAIAGGDTVVRDVFSVAAVVFGVRLHVPNCYVGTGPGC
jgi:hypothetical protein